MEKQTSKREYRFVIDTVNARVTIVDAKDNELREFYPDHLPATVQAILPLHGLKQKLTDDTMVSKIGEDGDRLIALDNLWAQLVAGEWEKERQGVARPPEVAIRLVMELMKVERPVSEASLKAAGKEKWEAILANHKERAGKIAEKIAAEKKAAEAMDLGSLVK